MQKIPVAMATQHPDSASKHIPTREEVDESILAFDREKGFNCDEYLVDYMGKLTPYHQIGQIVQRIHEKTNLVPGVDVFVTPRMVSSFEEEPFRQLMTMLAIVEGIHYCSENFNEQGIIEVVQAAATVEALRNCKARCEDLLNLVGKHLNMKTEDMNIRIIPLFGGLAEHLSIEQMLSFFIKDVNIKDYMRVFIGKSEAALLYGHLASTLSCKLAITSCRMIEETQGVGVYPILGCGTLPFRGHMTLENAENFLREYQGVRTFTIQSGLRYDHGLEETRALIEKIKIAVDRQPLEFDKDQISEIERMIFIFAKNYLLELSEIAEKASLIAEYIPDQRERLLNVEEVAYYRELRNVESILRLCPDKDVKKSIMGFAYTAFHRPPRWVKFVASTYTCGLPPEFIGLGSALREIKETMGRDSLERLLNEFYPSLDADVRFASKFLDRNPEHNILLTRRSSEGINELEKLLKLEEPDNRYIILSRLASSYIRDILVGKSSKGKKLAILIEKEDVAEYLKGLSKENLSKMILDLGRIRKSLA